MRTAACHVLHKMLLKFMGKRIKFLVDIRWIMYVNGHGQSCLESHFVFDPFSAATISIQFYSHSLVYVFGAEFTEWSYIAFIFATHI